MNYSVLKKKKLVPIRRVVFGFLTRVQDSSCIRSDARLCPLSRFIYWGGLYYTKMDIWPLKRKKTFVSKVIKYL